MNDEEDVPQREERAASASPGTGEPSARDPRNDVTAPVPPPSSTGGSAPPGSAAQYESAARTSPPSHRRSIEPGSQLGRYIAFEKLGEGGMGAVYAGYDPELHRRVAIKVLHVGDAFRESVLSTGPRKEGQERLLREAQALAQLGHPNVVSIYDVGTYEDCVFIAMEFIEGQNVRQWLHAAPRSWREILALFIEAGKGLAAAHEKGLVHRDFKPDNVVRSAEGRVYVLDFGLARIGDSDTAVESASTVAPAGSLLDSGKLLEKPLTQVGLVIGTVPYMAPELFAGKPASVRTDLFAFAVSLYEALFSVRPYPDRKTWKLVDPPPGTSVPAWVRKLLVQALSPAPDARPESMQALLDLLARDPTPRRRQAAMIAGGLALVAASTVAIVKKFESTSQLCRVGAEGLFAKDAASRIRQGFLATKDPYAEDTFAHLLPVLEGYARAIIGAQQTACVEARIHGTQTEEVLGLKLDCLTRRRTELLALTDVLAVPSQSVMGRAVAAAHALIPVDVCNDVEALKAPVRPPEAPELRARVDALRKDLAHARALLGAGEFADALSVATKLATAADALGYAPLRGEAWQAVGNAHDSLDQPEEARKAFEQSLIAAQAGRDHLTLASASMNLVWNAYFTNDTVKVPFWSKLSHAALEAGGGDPKTEARLLMATGAVADYEGRLDDAVASMQKALQVLEPTGLEARIATAHSNLGFAYRRLARYSDAVTHERQALALVTKLFGPDHPDMGRSLNGVGLSVLGESGPTDEVKALLERSAEIRRARLGEKHFRVAESAYDLSLFHLERGEYARALELAQVLERTDPRAGGNSPEYQAHVGHLLEALGRPDEALRYRKKAAEIADGRGEGNLEDRAAMEWQLAVALATRGQVRESQAFLDSAFAKWERSRKTRPLLHAEGLKARGELHVRAGRTQEGLADLTASLKLLEQRLGTGHHSLVRTLLPIAEAELALRRPAAARGTLERALVIFERVPLAPELLGQTRFALARALHDEADPQSSGRVRKLLTLARADLARSEAASAPSVMQKLDGWARRSGLMSDGGASSSDAGRRAENIVLRAAEQGAASR